MQRTEREYEALSKGFDFLFSDPHELDSISAEMQIQGVLIEMWELLSNIKDKESSKYREARNRYLKLFKAIGIIDKLTMENKVLKYKLLRSENELANYQFIYSQNHGSAKTSIGIDNQNDERLPYTD